MPIVVDDSRLAEALNLRITPQHVVIGRDGRIDYVAFLADGRLDTALSEAQAPAPAGEPPTLSSPPRTQPLAPAERSPDLSAVTLAGRTVRAHDASDARPTVFVFMSSWCESYLANQRPEIGAECRQVREQIASLARSDARVRWLGVATGVWSTEEELRELRRAARPASPVAARRDGRLVSLIRRRQLSNGGDRRVRAG